jgi:hypothetical protein
MGAQSSLFDVRAGASVPVCRLVIKPDAPRTTPIPSVLLVEINILTLVKRVKLAPQKTDTPGRIRRKDHRVWLEYRARTKAGLIPGRARPGLLRAGPVSGRWSSKRTKLAGGWTVPTLRRGLGFLARL